MLAQRGFGVAQLHRRLFVLVALRAAGKVVEAPVAAVVLAAVVVVVVVLAAGCPVAARVAVGLRLGGGRRRGALEVDRAIGGHPQRAFDPVVFAFEQGVFGERLFHFLLEFKRRELQQSNRLLQLWGQCQMLRETKLKRRFHATYSMRILPTMERKLLSPIALAS
ncbi:hypothetical protein D3C72_1761380 [compost metagenome]